MREILFRGKNQLGGWTFGYYVKHINRTPCPMGDRVKPKDVEHLIMSDCFSDWGMPRSIEATPVAPDTVGQYTGLTDKNGMKIFEGDILEFYRGFLDDSPCVSVMKVVFNEISVMDMIQEWSGVCYNLSLDNQPFYKVIGNIYDNPELLEEQP